MILDMLEDKSREVLLSSFDLCNNDLNDLSINAFFRKKILENFRLNSQFVDVYLSFFTFEIQRGNCSNFEFYKKLDKEIKVAISDRSDALFYKKTGNHIYYKIRILSSQGYKYFVIYLSNNSSYSKYNSKNYISSDKEEKYFVGEVLNGVIKLTISCLAIEDRSKSICISDDLFNGDLLFNMIKTERSKTRLNLSGFKLITYIKDGVWSFKLSTKEYISNNMKDANLSINGDLNLVDKKWKKVDARNSKRRFIDFNDEGFMQSKYSSYLSVYEMVLKALDILNLRAECNSFKPNFVFNDFLTIKEFNKTNNVVVLISGDDKRAMDKKHPDDIGNLLSYIKGNFSQTPSLIVFDKIEDVKINNESQYLCLMLGGLDDGVVKLDVGDKHLNWNSTSSLFADLRMDGQFFKLGDFDDYTRMKIKNLNALMLNGEGGGVSATQGLIIDCDNGLGEVKMFDNSIYKSLVDLYLKDQLFNKGVIELASNEFKNIKILKKDSIKTYSYKGVDKSVERPTILFSFLELDCGDNKDNKKYSVVDRFIIESKDENIPEILYDKFKSNLDNVNDYERFNCYLILLDNKYLVRVNDKDGYTPQIIGEKDTVLGEKNPNRLILNAKDSGFYDKVQQLKKDREDWKTKEKAMGRKVGRGIRINGVLSRSRDFDRSQFYPFLLPSINVIANCDNVKVGESQQLMVMISVEDNKAYFFVNQSGSAIKSEISKSNVIEGVAVFKRSDSGVYKKANIEEVKNVLNFYLKSMTYNLISNKKVAKKTLITKMVDILLQN